LGEPPLVTIGVPVCNGGRYRAEALDSVLAQDDSRRAILVSDNDPTDAIPDICRRYAAADRRGRWWRNGTSAPDEPVRVMRGR